MKKSPTKKCHGSHSQGKGELEQGREKGNDFIPRAMKEDDDKFVYEKTRGGKLRILALKRTVTKKEKRGGDSHPLFLP